MGFPKDSVPLDKQKHEGIDIFEALGDLVQEVVAFVQIGRQFEHFEELAQQLHYPLPTPLELQQCSA